MKLLNTQNTKQYELHQNFVLPPPEQNSAKAQHVAPKAQLQKTPQMSPALRLPKKVSARAQQNTKHFPCCHFPNKKLQKPGRLGKTPKAQRQQQNALREPSACQIKKVTRASSTKVSPHSHRPSSPGDGIANSQQGTPKA
jgi:hypothetical protein